MSPNPTRSPAPIGSARTSEPHRRANAGTMKVAVLAAVGVVRRRTRKKIGQATAVAPADAALTSINVPITGTVADTVGTDLVVEVSTDDFSGTGNAFYIGSTASAETHPSFLSSVACGANDPTPTADIGYPDMHIIEAVNVTD